MCSKRGKLTERQSGISGKESFAEVDLRRSHQGEAALGSIRGSASAEKAQEPSLVNAEKEKSTGKLLVTRSRGQRRPRENVLRPLRGGRDKNAKGSWKREGVRRTQEESK